MAVRIITATKPDGNLSNPHEAISYLGWINPATGKSGRSSRQEVYDFVKNGGEAYVLDRFGNRAKLVARLSAWGNPYVQTVADGKFTDNLLALPKCA